MGKTTGFLEYKRAECPERPPLVRLQDFSEFHGTLPEGERQRQAGRCMDCGVPFCQAGVRFDGKLLGCPLHNLIPEWNDMLWLGNWEHALSRLLKTNCFPEFTGRVCPAPCEGACTCGTFDRPVTIRDNELAIIEHAFQSGLMGPHPPKKRSGRSIGVVGSGPAGLAVAYYLNRRGHAVTVLEKAEQVGGLLTYGIPSMKLDKKIVARRIRLMEKEGIRFVTGVEVGRDLSPEDLDSAYDAVVFACGARKPRPLSYEGEGGMGLCYGLDYLTDAAKALEAGREPNLSASGKRVAVIGAGDTASDCVAVALRQGCESVFQLIRKPAAWYAEGSFSDYAQVEAEARFGGKIRRFETEVKAVTCDKEGRLQSALLTTPQGEEELELDLLIVASGFSGCEEQVFQTQAAMPHPEKVFSAGDMVLGASLVVLAIADGRRAAADVDRWLMGYTNIE